MRFSAKSLFRTWLLLAFSIILINSVSAEVSLDPSAYGAKPQPIQELLSQPVFQNYCNSPDDCSQNTFDWRCSPISPNQIIVNQSIYSCVTHQCKVEVITKYYACIDSRPVCGYDGSQATCKCAGTSCSAIESCEDANTKNTFTCNSNSGLCEQQQSTDCSGETPVCSGGKCICTSTSTCGSGETCINGKCSVKVLCFTGHDASSCNYMCSYLGYYDGGYVDGQNCYCLNPTYPGCPFSSGTASPECTYQETCKNAVPGGSEYYKCDRTLGEWRSCTNGDLAVYTSSACSGSPTDPNCGVPKVGSTCKQGDTSVWCMGCGYGNLRECDANGNWQLKDSYYIYGGCRGCDYCTPGMGECPIGALPHSMTVTVTGAPVGVSSVPVTANIQCMDGAKWTQKDTGAYLGDYSTNGALYDSIQSQVLKWNGANWNTVSSWQGSVVPSASALGSDEAAYMVYTEKAQPYKQAWSSPKFSDLCHSPISDYTTPYGIDYAFQLPREEYFTGQPNSTSLNVLCYHSYNYDAYGNLLSTYYGRRSTIVEQWRSLGYTIGVLTYARQPKGASSSTPAGTVIDFQPISYLYDAYSKVWSWRIVDTYFANSAVALASDNTPYVAYTKANRTFSQYIVPDSYVNYSADVRLWTPGYSKPLTVDVVHVKNAPVPVTEERYPAELGGGIYNQFHKEVFDGDYVFSFLKIGIDANNKPHIFYYDDYNKKLKYWGPASGNAPVVVDDATPLSAPSNIYFDSSNNPTICYLKKADVYKVRCVQKAGNSWSKSELKKVGDDIMVDGSQQLYLSQEGSVYVTYLALQHTGAYLESCSGCYPTMRENINNILRLARWTGNDWSVQDVDKLFDSSSSRPTFSSYSLLGFDSQNFPIFAYQIRNQTSETFNWGTVKYKNVYSSVESGGCNPTTYRLKKYDDETVPASCPTDYNEYQAGIGDTEAAPYTVTERMWLCGAAKDVNGYSGFSTTPKEFNVRSCNYQASRVCAGGVCTSNQADTALCCQPDSCVFNGECYSDIGRFIKAYKESAEIRAKWEETASNTDADTCEENPLFERVDNTCQLKKMLSGMGALTGHVTAVNAPSATPLNITYEDLMKLVKYNSELVSDDAALLKLESGRNTFFTSVNTALKHPGICDPGEWVLPNATLTGTVVNVTGQPVAGVTVKVVGTPYSAVTDSSGNYEILLFLETNNFDITAEKLPYETSYAYGVEIPDYSETTQDFTLYRQSEQCNDDCTKADGLCHAECNGKGLCSFLSPETASACDMAAPGIITDPADPSKQILCCKGASYTPTKANIRILCGENAISVRMPVLFKGKITNMVLTVFDAAGCTSS